MQGACQQALAVCQPPAQVQGLYEQLPQDSDVVGVHLIHVPNTDKYLYMVSALRCACELHSYKQQSAVAS